MSEKLLIGNRAIGSGERTFIIAETGINHNGDISRAHEMIDVAAEAGVDCVKFHTHLADDEMLNVTDTAQYINESQYQLIKKMELSLEQHIELKEHTEERGLMFLSTPFSREAADLLVRIDVPAFKIGSGELTNEPFLKHVASMGKPMIVSTGMSSYTEVVATVALLKSWDVQFCLMQCTSMYPTPSEEVHLNVISRYKREFQVPVGFSDHTKGNYMAFAAVALGACLVEKHFTMSREWPGPDQKASIEPDELTDLVKGIRIIELGLDDEKEANEDEQELQKLFRESVVAIHNIPSGSTITQEMVWVKRPGFGIPANQMAEVIGKKSKRDIPVNTMLSWDDID